LGGDKQTLIRKKRLKRKVTAFREESYLKRDPKVITKGRGEAENCYSDTQVGWGCSELGRSFSQC